MQHFYRRAERAVRRRRYTIHTHRHATCSGNLGRHFRPWQHTALAWLGALAEFELNHFDLWVAGVNAKFFGVKTAIIVATTKVTRSNLPHQITTMHTVVLADRAFACIVRKAAAFSAVVQRQNGIGAQSTKAHGRDIEHTHSVGLGAAADRCTYGNAKVV